MDHGLNLLSDLPTGGFERQKWLNQRGEESSTFQSRYWFAKGPIKNIYFKYIAALRLKLSDTGEIEPRYWGDCILRKTCFFLLLHASALILLGKELQLIQQCWMQFVNLGFCEVANELRGGSVYYILLLIESQRKLAILRL